jgi:hypothetical protein
MSMGYEAELHNQLGPDRTIQPASRFAHAGYMLLQHAQLICPNGLRLRISVNPLSQKYFCFSERQISGMVRSSRLVAGGAYRGRHET